MFGCGHLLHRRNATFWSVAFGPPSIQKGVCITVVDVWRLAIMIGAAGCLINGGDQVWLFNLYDSNYKCARVEFWSLIC